MSLIFQANSAVIAPKQNVCSFEINYFHSAQTVFNRPQTVSTWQLAQTKFIRLQPFPLCSLCFLALPLYLPETGITKAFKHMSIVS